MSLIDVAQAQQRLFSLSSAVEAEDLPFAQADGRWLSCDVMALRDQPWSDLSAMDGYAIRYASLPGPWTVIGESAAGGDSALEIGPHPHEAVRIFTGAAMPQGADCVLVQEEAEMRADQLVLTGEGPDRPGKHVRARGSDFANGTLLLGKGSKVGARHLALAAIGGHSMLPMHRTIKVALFSTGNELVEPGMQGCPADLPASNGVMLRAMLTGMPVTIDDLGIIPDDLAAQTDAFRRALTADIIVTTGGASVGDHDLVKPAFEAVGGSVDFWRIALRPGKPLIAGRKDRTLFLGLPGNPVSAFVTATLFLLPLVRHMSGANDPLPPLTSKILTQDMPATSARANYIRAIVENSSVRPCSSQDSAALLSLANANALIIRPPHSGSAKKGDQVEVILLS